MITHQVPCPEGWTLGLLEYPARGKSRGAVYLQHGLGSNAYNFDLEHNFRPAPWLASRGWRVFSGGLRGRAPGEPHGGRGWNFSDCEADVRALMAQAARLGGPCHVVGHSLGGILALLNSAGARSIATLGSALNYSQGASVFGKLMPLEPYLPLPAVLPARFTHKLMAPLWASGLIPSPVYENGNMTFKGGMAFHCNQGDLSAGELRELGRRVVAGPHELPEVKAPWLCVVGELDTQCPPATARWTYERLSAPKKDWLLVGGTAHVDLVIGSGAERVWSAVENAMMAADDV